MGAFGSTPLTRATPLTLLTRCHQPQEIPFFGGIGDYERQEFVRSELPGRLYLIWTEYKAMLYGGSATPQEKSPHFTRAKLGVIFMGTQGADLLYRKRGCLNPDPWMCLNPGTSMYEMSRHGIVSTAMWCAACVCWWGGRGR